MFFCGLLHQHRITFLEVSEFELELPYYFQFRTNNFGKAIEPPYFPSYVLTSITITGFGIKKLTNVDIPLNKGTFNWTSSVIGSLWHYITRDGWYAKRKIYRTKPFCLICTAVSYKCSYVSRMWRGVLVVADKYNFLYIWAGLNGTYLF